MVKVLIADNLPQEIYAPLFRQAGIEFIDTILPGSLEQVIADCEGLIVRSATKVTSELLDKAPKLRIIGRAGIGYDNIDIDAATLRGIVVENTPDANSVSAAEHTMGLIYSLARNISAADAALKSGRWEKSLYLGTELNGKRLGIIGLGRIGQLVAKLAKGNGMEIVFHDPYISEEVPIKLSCTPLPLDELLRTSDYVTLHAVLTSETRCMIDAKKLTLMRPTAKLINTARGELVDEDALYNTIKSGRLSGAAIDVFEKEPYRGKLLELRDKVIVTPHLAGSTIEAQTRVTEEITSQIIAYLREGRYTHAVNVSKLSLEIKPYIDLVERMGYFVSKLIKAPIENVKVTCYGELAQSDIIGISNVALVGLLSEHVDINLVNASQVAKQRGINFFETRSTEQIDYRNLISLEVFVKAYEPIYVKGILFEKKGPRIVGLNGCDIEFEPSGILLISSHQDVPGVIAYISRILEENNINIATVSLSREAQRGKAIGVYRVDSLVAEGIIKKIAEGSDKVYNVQQIVIPKKLSPRL